MSGRRAQGEGTVYKDTTRDRWIGAVTIGGKRRKVTGKTKTEARARLSKLLAAKSTGAAVGNRRLTVADVLSVFLDREVPNRTNGGRPLAPSTIETYRWTADIITTEIGTARIDRLEVAEVEGMLDRLAKRKDRPLSAASLRKVRGTLDRATEFAIRRGEAVRNVARVATIPPTATARRRRRSLSPDEARELLSALPAERNGAMFALSLLVGLRPGEASGLYWSDIDGDIVNVTRAVRRAGGRVAISDDLKTTASKRTIRMPAELVTMLADHRSAQNLERIAADEWDDSRLVFAGIRYVADGKSSGGTVLSPSTVRLHLADICQRIGITVVAPNELRHSCASLLSDAGVSNEEIADLLGHTTTRMVDETYRHRLRPVVDVAAQATWASEH